MRHPRGSIRFGGDCAPGIDVEGVLVTDEGIATERPASPDVSEIVMYVAGGLLLVASFLPMLEIDLAPSEDDLGFGELFGAFIDTEWTAWSNAFSIFPLVTLPVLCVLVLVAARAVERFAGTTLPPQLVGVPVPVLRAAVAAFAGVTVASQIIRALVDSGDEDEGSFVVGPGGWLAALALVALVVTAVQEVRSSPARVFDRRRPDSRATGTVIVGAIAVAVASALDAWSSDDEGGVTAWGEGARPVYLVPLVMTALAAATTVLDLRAEQRRHVLGMDLGRWRVLLAASALFAAVALVIGNPLFGGFGSFIDTGVGMYLSVVGAATVLVGTLLRPTQVGGAGSEEQGITDEGIPEGDPSSSSD